MVVCVLLLYLPMECPLHVQENNLRGLLSYSFFLYALLAEIVCPHCSGNALCLCRCHWFGAATAGQGHWRRTNFRYCFPVRHVVCKVDTYVTLSRKRDLRADTRSEGQLLCLQLDSKYLHQAGLSKSFFFQIQVWFTNVALNWILCIFSLYQYL